MVVELGNPFQRRHFYCWLGFPWRAAVNEFGFVEPVDGLRQSIDAPMSIVTPRIDQIGKTERVQFPYDIALQATTNFLIRHTFLGSAIDVSPRPRIAPHPYHGGGPQGVVGRSVSTPVQSVSDRFA